MTDAGSYQQQRWRVLVTLCVVNATRHLGNPHLLKYTNPEKFFVHSTSIVLCSDDSKAITLNL